LSLTQTLRSFEQGLLAPGLVLAVVAAIGGFLALAVIWLHPGVQPRSKLARSVGCVIVVAAAVALLGRIGLSIDLAEDRRNSFSAADQRQLATMHEPLRISVHLAPEDPRYVDLRRNVLARLERVMPDLTIRLAATGKSLVGSESDEHYGEIAFSYGGRTDINRSDSPREDPPLVYRVARMAPPPPAPARQHP